MIKHLCLIMDGNRRWAQKQGLLAFNGHRRGLEAIRIVCDYALDKNISYVSLYAFSLENLKRSQDEQQYLFSLIIDQAQQLIPELQSKGIKISFLGSRDHFPEHVLPSIDSLESGTAQGDKLHLNLLFCYGGRQDIVSATRQIAQLVSEGKLDPSSINEETFKNYLQTRNIPDPDIVIRTGGMHRLSNFMPYETIYSELFFIDTLWPDITTKELEYITHDYRLRTRKFGV